MKVIQTLHNGKLKQIRNRFGGNSSSWHAEAMFCRLRRRRALERTIVDELRSGDLHEEVRYETENGRVLLQRDGKYEVFGIYRNGQLVSGHVQRIGDDERSGRKRRRARRRRK